MSYEEAATYKVLTGVMRKVAILVIIVMGTACITATLVHKDCNDIIYYPDSRQMVCEINV